MKITKYVIMALLLSITLPVCADEEEEDVVKVVYQCDFPQPKRIHLMLNTLNNAIEYYNKNLIQYEIDVVALGPCLQYLMKDFKGTGFAKKPYLKKGGPTGAGTAARFKNLQLTGGDNIKFFACQNTMKKKKVKKEQLSDFVKVTPAGVIKVIDLQREGYAYIKIM
jgi:intracellular sulfur oxidation DsrE/DsrF family protein